jgi:4-hydroxy-tetrahydrodipicolinate synthase
VALKWALVARGILEHAAVRSPLLPLPAGADREIADAMRAAQLGKASVPAVRQTEAALA